IADPLLPAVTPTPAGRTHVVSRGDTLFSIAKRYDVTVAAIQQANNLAGSTIYPGQTLTIP
ncbi:MAG: LysM peptidoglycan-binding domain-containing protein, partial [Anaerolineales bacterium]|nr:LysM peptidoglycan-binding domain-containing protein [Anaerolineales bacterium]